MLIITYNYSYSTPPEIEQQNPTKYTRIIHDQSDELHLFLWILGLLLLS